MLCHHGGMIAQYIGVSKRRQIRSNHATAPGPCLRCRGCIDGMGSDARYESKAGMNPSLMGMSGV
jgi:hypothetical protein